MSILPFVFSVLALLQTAGAPKVTAKLYADRDSIQPGGTVALAVEINVPKDWHIYHPIQLDTGAATTISFDAPKSVTFGELRFPTPTLGQQADLEYLALEGRVVVLTTMQLAAGAPAEPIAVKAHVRALACKELCFPVSTEAGLRLNVAARPPGPANAELFKEVRAALPAAFEKAKYIEGSGVAVPSERIKPGDSGEIVLTVRVRKEHHIQDRNPGVEGLIPSRLFIETLDGLAFEKQQWPEPRVHEMPGFGKVRELAGEFRLRVPFKIDDAKFASGPVALRLLFTYQCCTDAGQCYPPEAAEGVVRFVADTPNPPVRGARGTLFAEISTGTTAAEPTVTERPEPATAGPAKPIESAGEFVVPQLTAADWAAGVPWQKWRPGLAEALSRNGHPVYVDYTAKWCLTCQTNKKVVLETEVVRAKMRDMGVIPIEADFTNPEPLMQREINRYRPTVPVNIILPAGKPNQIALLPVLLTRQIVFDALEHPERYPVNKPENLLLVILAGFLGGLILNVMPCVLPVISIKILSFVQQAGEDPRRVFRLGLAFAVGNLVWFWTFAALASIGEVPWQYPEVIIALGSILFVFALNLFGIFELTLPGAAAGQLDALASREGYTGAFLKGLLATLLGTACTAPFLAGAMAWALTQPTSTVYMVFTAAGLGMGTPYLLLSAKPAWLRFVPKPGPWMVTFKQGAGFVLLATVVWLLWILADEIDGKGVVWTVAFWGFLGLSVWLLGKQRPTWERGQRLAVWGASVALALLGLYFCYFVMYNWNGRKTAADPTVNAAVQATPSAENASPSTRL